MDETKTKKIIDLIRASVLLGEAEKKEWEEEIVPNLSEEQFDAAVEILLEGEKEAQKTDEERVAELKERIAKLKQVSQYAQKVFREAREEQDQEQDQTEMDHLLEDLEEIND